MMDKDVDARPEWEAERKAAGRVYWWLLLSPFVTVPCCALQAIEVESAWVAVVPLIFHIPLLLMSYGAGSRFVWRHMQQALLLIALRAGVAAISLNLLIHGDLGNGLELFFLGNGSLWLFGSLRGLKQVKRGDCWLMRRKGEDGELPRPWAVPVGVPAAPAAGIPAGAPVSLPPAAHSPFEAPADPNAAFEDGLRLLGTGKRAETTAYFLTAFRGGPPDLRRRAVTELEKLGEVEAF